MRIVKGYNDIRLLQKANIKEEIINVVNNVFESYYGKESNGSELNLNNIIKIVLLERGDNVRNLKEVGLYPEVNGIFGLRNFHVSVIKKDSLKAYVINTTKEHNEVVYIFAENSFDSQVEDWINLMI